MPSLSTSMMLLTHSSSLLPLWRCRPLLSTYFHSPYLLLTPHRVIDSFSRLSSQITPALSSFLFFHFLPPLPPPYFTHHLHANPLFAYHIFTIISPLLPSRFLTLVLSICRKKSCPSPLFSEAPSTRPGMSAIVTRSKSEYSTTPIGILK